MKKKLSICTLALLGTVLVTVGFAACDKGSNEVGKDTDLSTVKSDTLTEAQWRNAFKAENFNNFKAVARITQTQGAQTQTGSQELTIDGDKCYEKDARYFDGEPKEYYYSTTEGVNYTYEIENSVWSRHESNHSTVSEYRSTFTAYGERYSDFEYSDSDKGYKLTQTEEHDSYSYDLTIIVKFTDGKLSGIITDNSSTDHGEERNYHTEITVYDYGKASVTLPSVQNEEQGDDEPAPNGSVEGKAYRLTHYESDDCDPDLLASMNDSIDMAMTFYFEDSETFRQIVESGSWTVVTTGTYTQSGATITLTPRSQTINGNPIDPSDANLLTATAYAEGNCFYVKEVPPQESGESYTIYLVCELITVNG